MNIGIIGAGFTGLAAGHELLKKGFSVTIFERETKPGGLAVGFKDNKWKWALERHYHHLFVSDWAIRKLASWVNHKIIFKRPLTSAYVDGKIYQLDSPASLFRFKPLPVFARLRTGVVLSYLRLTPFWKPFERVTAVNFLRQTMGGTAWRILWEPLFVGKFGKYKDEIPASWFWARIKKRSASLGYPEGGFEALAQSIAKEIERFGGKILYQTGVLQIRKDSGKIIVLTDTKREFRFESVICTLPTPIFLRVTKGLPTSYKKGILRLQGLGAVNLVLALRQRFFEDGTYWLNINERDFPFLGVMEHTNFMDASNYGGDRIVYVGNYLEPNHPYFKKTEKELIEEFLPYLQKISPKFKKSWIRKAWVFKAPFAQPIITLNYSRILPPFETPIPGLFLANIQQVYPWDRGTNYAVELGEKVSQKLL